MRLLVWASIVTIVVVIAFSPTTHLRWTTDDSYVLHNLQSVQLRDNLFPFNVDRPTEVAGAWWDGVVYQRRFVRLVPSAIMAVEVRALGQNAQALHVASLVIHVLNTLLVFGLARRVVVHDGKAAVLALIFGVHPAAYEPIGWFACQPILIGTSFALLTVWLWLRYRAAPTAEGLAAAIALMFVSVTSYEALLPLPFVVLFADYRLPSSRATGWRERAAVLAVLVPYALLSMWNRSDAQSYETMYRPTIGEAWFTARVDLGNYLYKALGLFKPSTPPAYWIYNALGEPLAVVPLVLLLGAVGWWARRRPLAIVGLVAFFVFLAPPWFVRATIGTLNVPTFRQLYLPILGLCTVAAAASVRPRFRTVAAIVCPILLGFVVLDRHPKAGGIGAADARAAVARALEGSARSTPVIVSGAFFPALSGACPYDLTLDWPDRRQLLLVPPTRSGRAPLIRRDGERTFTASSPDGFLIAAPQTPPPARVTGRYSGGWFRLKEMPPPLLTQGHERFSDAEITTADGARTLRFTLEQPLDAYVLLQVTGCKNVRRLSWSASDAPHE